MNMKQTVAAMGAAVLAAFLSQMPAYASGEKSMTCLRAGADLIKFCGAGAVTMPVNAESSGIEWIEDQAIAQLFVDAGVDGTFVSCRSRSDVMVGHNSHRALKRLPPASTFKIPHTLVALKTSAVSDINESFAWDGSPRRFGFWERDMTLAEAFEASNLHVYQEVASRIGRVELESSLVEFNYGNRQVGPWLSSFWLQGPLEISAVEQCRFLLSLATGQFPVDNVQWKVLRQLMASDAGGGVTLYAKTGWANAPDPGPGWWVGWIEGTFGVVAFALQIDMPEPAHAALRVELGSKALVVLDLLPSIP